METFDPGKLYYEVLRLSLFMPEYEAGVSKAILVNDYTVIKRRIAYICEELERIGFLYSLGPARELYDVIFEQIKKSAVKGEPENWILLPPQTVHRYHMHVRDLSVSLERELSKKLVMFLPENKIGYFDGSKNLFSIKVRESFPSANIDMDEAAKCFALERYTASVFHSMRIMEAGLNEMGESLNLEVGKNLENALQDIQEKIDFCSRTPTSAWKDVQSFYSEAVSHIANLKDAWRNYTMRIKQHYDEPGSMGILNSVSDFMRHVAKKLHE
ncbi:MAG: hypothetical protein ACLQPD_14315 [Desulfomonilaceae bacterium]